LERGWRAPPLTPPCPLPLLIKYSFSSRYLSSPDCSALRRFCAAIPLGAARGCESARHSIKQLRLVFCPGSPFRSCELLAVDRHPLFPTPFWWPQPFFQPRAFFPLRPLLALQVGAPTFFSDTLFTGPDMDFSPKPKADAHQYFAFWATAVSIEFPSPISPSPLAFFLSLFTPSFPRTFLISPVETPLCLVLIALFFLVSPLPRYRYPVSECSPCAEYNSSSSLTTLLMRSFVGLMVCTSQRQTPPPHHPPPENPPHPGKSRRSSNPVLRARTFTLWIDD